MYNISVSPHPKCTSWAQYFIHSDKGRQKSASKDNMTYITTNIQLTCTIQKLLYQVLDRNSPRVFQWIQKSNSSLEPEMSMGTNSCSSYPSPDLVSVVSLSLSLLSMIVAIFCLCHELSKRGTICSLYPFLDGCTLHYYRLQCTIPHLVHERCLVGKGTKTARLQLLFFQRTQH